MNRAELQLLANERIADAKSLLTMKRWSAAYYLAGYSVECALKSCVLVRLTAASEVVFTDRKFSEKCWTHNLAQLVDLANLKISLDASCAADTDLFDNWNSVKLWNETTRYVRTSKAVAESLFTAIVDKKHGVLPWIKRRW